MSRSPGPRLAALGAAVAAAVIAVTPAAAAGRRPGGPAHPRVSVEITSVSPQTARPGASVTVSGIIINPAATPAAGLSVQLWSSGTPLANRTVMGGYLTSPVSTGLDSPVAGAVQALASPVPAHSSQAWKVVFHPNQVGMRAFGVYPLAAALNGPLQQLGVARTLLPYWPGRSQTHGDKPLRIAWVWPLIDTPQRAACPALSSDELATSMASGGRLNGLLAAGQTAAGRKSHLTWAIDPALLSDASQMTRPYLTGGGSLCTGAAHRPASAAASAWLAGVKAVTARQNYFTTPYADVDVAALAHRGLDTELTSAFGSGRSAAHRLLGHVQRTGPLTGAVAWPPNGIADYSVLGTLAANKVATVVLDSNMMPPQVQPPYTPGAVTRTPTGYGTELHVALADHTLGKILAAPQASVPGAVAPPPAGGAQPKSPPYQAALSQAATFAKEQWFLAETAMIAAEEPALARSVVAAPPRRWNPAPGLAGGLLGETSSAPWLRPVSLASLVSAHPPAGSVARHQPPQHRVSRSELKPPLLRQVQRLTSTIRLLGAVLAGGGHGYQATALAATESSAWRGNAAEQRRAQRLVDALTDYTRAQLQKIQIIDPNHVTLGGKSGSVPVSIRNQLTAPITVRLTVSAPSSGQVNIEPFGNLIQVQPGTLRTIKIPVQAAAAGSTTLTLRLTTPQGKPLPGQTTSFTVVATHFGTLAIVIIVVALVVFVLAAAVRAIRRGGGPPGADGEAEAGTDGEGDGEGEAEADGTVEDVAEDGRAPESEAGTEAGAAGPSRGYALGGEGSLDGGQGGTGRPGEDRQETAAGGAGAPGGGTGSMPDQATPGEEADTVVSAGAENPHPAKEADDHASTPGRAHRR